MERSLHSDSAITNKSNSMEKVMRFFKRYIFTGRDENGKLLCTGEYTTVEEFDRFAAEYPPASGHTLTLFDSMIPLDDFGLTYKTVRTITGV